jgi:hypothetical protein
MKRAILALFLILALTPLYSAILPRDEWAGLLAVVGEESSLELKKAKEASNTGYSDLWLESFVAEEAALLINSMHFKSLMEALPMSNPVFSNPEKGIVKARDLDKGTRLTFFFNEEGKIISLSFSD